MFSAVYASKWPCSQYLWAQNYSCLRWPGLAEFLEVELFRVQIFTTSWWLVATLFCKGGGGPRVWVVGWAGSDSQTRQQKCKWLTAGGYGRVGGWGRTWGGSKLKEKRRLRPSYCKRYLARADSGPARHPFEGAVLCAVPSTPLTTRSMPPALPGPIHEALPGPGGCRDLFLCL